MHRRMCVVVEPIYVDSITIFMYNDEIWKDIPGYEGSYQVSDYGRVKSLRRIDASGKTRKEKLLKLHETADGYYSITLFNSGKKRRYRVHRLVYLAFNGEIPEGMECNHKNENKKDNRPSNIEILSKADNLRYGTRTKRAAKTMTGKLVNRPDQSKWVIKLSLDNEILHFYPSTMEAERETGIKRTAIGACCRGTARTAGGFKWKYVE